MSELKVIRGAAVPRGGVSAEVVGEEHGGVGASLIFVDMEPGRGPGLHRHRYTELFVVLEGRATILGGDEGLTMEAGDVVVIPAGQPHGFKATGEGRYRQISVHLSPRFETEWL